MEYNDELSKALWAPPEPAPQGASDSNAGLGVGEMKLPKLDGYEPCVGVELIGEPKPIAGTDKLQCMAVVDGALCWVELRLRFLAPNKV